MELHQTYFDLALLGDVAAPSPGPFGSFDTATFLSVVYPPLFDLLWRLVSRFSVMVSPPQRVLP